MWVPSELADAPIRLLCYLWKVMDISRWLETHGTWVTRVWKAPEGQSGELQAGQPHFSPWRFLHIRRRRWLGAVSRVLPWVNGAWLTWFSSLTKWLHFWMRGEQWMSLTLNSAISHGPFPVLHVSSPMGSSSFPQASRMHTELALPQYRQPAFDWSSLLREKPPLLFCPVHFVSSFCHSDLVVWPAVVHSEKNGPFRSPELRSPLWDGFLLKMSVFCNPSNCLFLLRVFEEHCRALQRKPHLISKY